MRTHARAAMTGAAIRHRSHLLSDPAGALSGGHRTCTSGSAPRLQTLIDVTVQHQAGAGAWRRQPEEHPVRPARPGVSGRRMRMVRRPGVRPGLLPESHAAEVPVAPQWTAESISRASTRWPHTYLAGVTGKPAGSKRAPRAAAGTASRARGRQVAGRVHHRRNGSAQTRARRRAARCCCSRCDADLRDVAQAWPAEHR